MEQKLILSSQIARVKNARNTPRDFTTVFDRPIVLGGNQRYIIGLDEHNDIFLAQRPVQIIRKTKFHIIMVQNIKE